MNDRQSVKSASFFRLSLVVLLVSSILTACSDASEQPVFGNAGAYLDSNQRIELEGEAMRGDADAANRLVTHYMYAEEDPYQLEIWWTVGMKDGDTNAKSSLGWLLTTGKGGFPNAYRVTAESCKRGRALLEEAKSSGDGAAASMLSEVPRDCNVKN